MKNVKTEPKRVLLIGIGNSGRQDDGLGWKFSEFVSLWQLPFLDIEFRYQLQVEDVVLVCRYEKVYFVDASHSKLHNGFEYRPCTTAQHYFFSSHLQTPETILYLAKEMFDKSPEATTIAIEGKDWGLGTNLSKTAELNLDKAISFFEKEFFPAVAEAGKIY